MTTVSILGMGNMGPAIASIIEKGGNTAQILGSNDTDQTVTGEIVVLAVPYPAIQQVLAQRADQLAGKIIVDITNPLNFETFDSLTVPADSSAAAEIQAALPNSRVLKAFNTTFAATLASGEIAGQPTTVVIAGDDADAKSHLAAVVTAVVTAGGLRAIDAGSLRRARELEAMGFLQIALAAGEKISWTGGFAVQA
ncbi:NADPH-dependent F420 reductase [Pseudarthrobacter sp. AB1]|uniref:NADPH-dependent F420 reductase n=1 Tax=Pseudarthrobacter sp. AB1 TaxID=2138309 RepID=UPI00186BA3E0|nr:NADPH-dependent F420 reductase [Pseudarthrobacter sp. AB1]MBE4716590.1 diguanylate cyclase [Pseudarthrobacter sp. AB1]